MSYIAYNNIKAFVSNGDEQSLLTSNYNAMYATSLTASNSTSYKRIKRIGQELDYYNQTGPKNTSISATVIPVTGEGQNQFNDFLALTGNFVSGSYIQVPNYRFEKCFLKSLQFSLEPWKPVSFNMQFDSYGLATGSGLQSLNDENPIKQLISPLRGMSLHLFADAFSQTINEYESLNFNIEVERLPCFEIANPYSAGVGISKITKTLEINGISNVDWLSDYQPNTFIKLGFIMPDANSFFVSGVLSSQAISVNGGGAVKINMRITEDMDLNQFATTTDFNYIITSDQDYIVDNASNRLISYQNA